MTDAGKPRRTDSASRTLKASPETIYRAFVDPEALLTWLPPREMSGQLDTFKPQVGGHYRMTLKYRDADHETPGKAANDADVVEGQFVELVPGERVVQLVEFESDDPSFAGTMKMTWALSRLSEGTRVTITCEDVPPGIRKEDHDKGLQMSLQQLAAFTEKRDSTK